MDTRIDAQIAAAHPWGLLALYAMLVSTGYALASREVFGAPWVVPPAAIDAHVPFAPAAAWPYATYLLLLPVLIILARRLRDFSRVLVAALGCGIGNVLLYLAIPTRVLEIPRAPGGTLLSFIQSVDTALCALPSGHVALPTSIAVAALLVSSTADESERRKWRAIAVLFALWTLMLAAAALLTKQHYFVDVVAGAAFGAFMGLTLAARESRAAAAKRERPALNVATVGALAREWTVIAVVVAIAAWRWNLLTAGIAMGVIATRQHALLVLGHDGVHCLVARGRRLNDFVVNAAVGVPMLLPVHLYRALHVSHHRHLGTERDPERVLLYRGQPWAYHPLRLGTLARQLAGDLFGWNNVLMAVRYFRERRDPRSPLRLPPSRAYPELIAQIAFFVATWAALALASPTLAMRLALLWWLPLVTLTQLLQKVRSFAEHADEGEADALSHSWSPGILGRLTIWPYNINYHREHHAHPSVPWNELPAAFPAVRQRPGRELAAHLWSGAAP